MKANKIFFVAVCAVISAGLAVSFLGCFGTGTMDGSIGMNISDQPVWGPSGYDRADYYYLPDIDSYYSIREHQYIYRDGANWRHESSLPSNYSNQDLYHSYKVVINEDQPYQNNVTHRAKYGSFIGMKTQPVIRDSRDPKYFVIKDHPEHEGWARNHNRRSALSQAGRDGHQRFPPRPAVQEKKESPPAPAGGDSLFCAFRARHPRGGITCRRAYERAIPANRRHSTTTQPRQ